MWAVIFIDTGVGTIARPQALDALERMFNIPPTARARLYDDVLALFATDGIEWRDLAAMFGVGKDDIACFAGWDEPDVVVQGCLNAIVAAQSDNLPLRFETKVALTTAVSHERVGDVLVVTIAAPAKEQQ